jgi:hypothetical protein
MRLIKLMMLPPLCLASVGMVMVMGLAGWGCYPKDCDPAKDPLRCKCPPGPCGDYPAAAADAGKEGGAR